MGCEKTSSGLKCVELEFPKQRRGGEKILKEIMDEKFPDSMETLNQKHKKHEENYTKEHNYPITPNPC